MFILGTLLLVRKRFALASIIFDLLVVRVFFPRSKKVLEYFSVLERKAGEIFGVANEKAIEPLRLWLVARFKQMVASYILRGDIELDARSRQNSEMPSSANSKHHGHNNHLNTPKVDGDLLMSRVESNSSKTKNE